MSTTLQALFAGLVAWLVSFIMPISGFLIFVTALVVADLITGMVAARKRAERIRSERMRATVTKVAMYFIAILAARGMDVVFLMPKDLHLDLTWFIAAFIAVTEFKSLLENVEESTGVDLWTTVGRKLGKIFGKDG